VYYFDAFASLVFPDLFDSRLWQVRATLYVLYDSEQVREVLNALYVFRTSKSSLKGLIYFPNK